jgi:hypothetical protein
MSKCKSKSAPCFETDKLSDTGKELDLPEALSCTVLDKSIRRHPLVSIQPNRLGQLVLFMVALLLKNTVCGESDLRKSSG